MMSDSTSRVSVHSALWAQQWGTDLAHHIEKAASLGFNGVELSLLGIEKPESRSLVRTARDVGIALNARRNDPTSPTFPVSTHPSDAPTSITFFGAPTSLRHSERTCSRASSTHPGVNLHCPIHARNGSIGLPNHLPWSRPRLRIGGITLTSRQ